MGFKCELNSKGKLAKVFRIYVLKELTVQIYIKSLYWYLKLEQKIRNKSVEIQEQNKLIEQLLLEIEGLKQEILDWKNENSDLEILLENNVEHSTNIEAELHNKNLEMSLYLQQVYCITTAAAAVEAGTFQSYTLDEVAARSDELGRLARVFQRMTEQVRAREEKLKQQVEELRVEIDQSRRMQQVSQITKSDSFQQLKQKVKQLRG